jgi:predicted transcriptional regulator
MPWIVEIGDEFLPEFNELDEQVRTEILAHSRLLQQFGPQLGRPRVDTLKDSRHTNMKELRFDAADGVWRVAFAFDPMRKAILLVAGDKSGVSQSKFYKRLIAKADDRFGCAFGAFETEGEEVNMPRNVNDIIKHLSPALRKKVEARAAHLIAEEMTLRELRRARKLSQVRVAKELGIGQEGVSKIEKRADLMISTLRKTVEAMGGSLALVAQFPDREPVILSGIAEDNPKNKPTGRKRAYAGA